MAGIFALAAAGMLFLNVRQAVRHADALVTADNGLKGTIQLANSDLLAVGLTLDQVQGASRSQKEYWDANTKKIGRLLDTASGAVNDLRGLEGQLAQAVAETNAQVNGKAIPQATEDLKSLRAAIEGIAPVLNALQKQASNPDIPATLANLRKTSENVASVTAHTEATAADVQAAVHRWTKPAHGAWSIIKGLLTPAAHAAELYHFL